MMLTQLTKSGLIGGVKKAPGLTIRLSEIFPARSLRVDHREDINQVIFCDYMRRLIAFHFAVNDDPPQCPLYQVWICFPHIIDLFPDNIIE